MLMRSTKLILLGGLASAALLLTACAPTASTDADSGDGSKPAEVQVGIVTSESGPLAGYGKQYIDGFKAGLEYVTDGTGEVDGTKINVTYMDDAGDPDKAVTAAKELIGEGTQILAGSAVSAAALAVAEQAAQNKVLFISGPAAADAITGVNEYTFRSGRQSAQDVTTAGDFLTDLEGKKVTVLAQNSAFGQGNEAAVKSILGAKGATVDSVLVAEDVTEFTPFAQKVMEGAPDLVFVAWAGATSGAMWQALSQQGVLDEIPVVTGLGDSATYGAYGEATEKIKFLSHYFPGVSGTEAEKAMIDDITKAGGTPDLFSPDGFNAAIMIAQAIKEGGGSVDGMIKALEGYSFDGVKGTTTIRKSDHALIQDMYHAELISDGDGFKPEKVGTSAADQVAPAETK